jgi:hypothetical protein
VGALNTLRDVELDNFYGTDHLDPNHPVDLAWQYNGTSEDDAHIVIHTDLFLGFVVGGDFIFGSAGVNGNTTQETKLYGSTDGRVTWVLLGIVREGVFSYATPLVDETWTMTYSGDISIPYPDLKITGTSWMPLYWDLRLNMQVGQPEISASPAYWQLESFDDWGVQFTSPTTTTLVNNTGADATIRARLTKPTAIATTSSSGGGATTLAELTDSTTATTDPLITSNLAVGHFWINSTSGEAYVCTDATTDDNVWTNIGSGVGGVGLTAMTGGTTSTYSVGGVSYKSHVFTGSGSFTVTSEGDADVLLVAGGGAGSSGTNGGAGGGAGGVIVQQLTLSATSYSFTIGAGGTAIHSVAQSDIGGNGEDSTFSTLTSIGGGAGGKWGSTVSLRNGQDGGSGGGGAEMHGGSGSTSGGAGYSGQGYDGGGSSAAFGGSGGGGAGAVGGSPTTNNGADGGIGLANDYSTGVDQYYSGGGGGHGDVPGTNTDGSGGLGGGGDIASGVGGGVNTGGGGAGGGYYAGHSPGNGGSGVLVVRYAI